MPLQVATTRRDPPTPAQNLYAFTRDATFGQWLEATRAFWDDPKTTLHDMAEYGRLDRYFLLVYLLNRHDALHPWLYARCREVEAEPYGYLDLWSRGHYKSTIITFAGSIQELLKDPEIKIVIFSHVRGIALEFLDQIKNELESNSRLKKMYPDVLYENPKKQSPQWSLEGLVVKRKTNPKEATVMAFGLVNGMPTGGHWDLRIYDDVVTEDSVTNPEQIQKTTQRLELSWNLGTHKDNDREMYIGTRYAFGDTYQSIEETGAVKVRKYPATDNGMMDGQPVFMSKAKWERMKQVTTIRTLACQQLLDPLQGGDQTFSMDMLKFYELRPLTLNVYIVCDPARTKKKTSNRTGIAVVGIDHAWNRYLLDGLCHRLSLSERWKWIRHYRKKWMAARGVQFVKVGYEVYGAHADLDHFQTMMELDGDYFPIEEVKWHREGPDSHIDRVQRLEPDMRGGRYFFPYDELIPEMEFRRRKMTLEDTHGRHKGGYFVKTSLQRQAEAGGSPEMVARPIIQRDEENNTYNLVEWMSKNELIYFPNIHVDWLDCLSRIYDMDTSAPTKRSEGELTPAPEPEY